MGAARGSGTRETGAEGRDLGWVSPSIHVAKVAAKLRERNFPTFTLHSPVRTVGRAAGRLPLRASLSGYTTKTCPRLHRF